MEFVLSPFVYDTARYITFSTAFVQKDFQCLPLFEVQSPGSEFEAQKPESRHRVPGVSNAT